MSKVKAPFQVTVYRRMFARHMRIAWQFRGLRGTWYRILAVVHREVKG